MRLYEVTAAGWKGEG